MIAFIDDEPALCRIFARVLARLGETVVAFSDPLAAVAHFEREPPDFVVCDYRMPGLTGFDVLRGLRVGTPFVMLSGDLDAADLALAPDSGVTAFLAKPLRPDDLLDVIRRLRQPTA